MGCILTMDRFLGMISRSLTNQTQHELPQDEDGIPTVYVQYSSAAAPTAALDFSATAAIAAAAVNSQQQHVVAGIQPAGAGSASISSSSQAGKKAVRNKGKKGETMSWHDQYKTVGRRVLLRRSDGRFYLWTDKITDLKDITLVGKCC